MRNTIFILTLFLVAACHNKNDLKRIDELEKENKELKEKIGPKLYSNVYKAVEKNILDSIILGVTIKDKMLSDGFDRFYAYTNTTSRSISLNTEYKSDIFLAIRSSEDLFDSVYYLVSDKNLKGTPYDDIGKMKIAYKNFVFKPQHIGWFYTHIIIPIKNKRTGEVRHFPIIDSFYVYK